MSASHKATNRKRPADRLVPKPVLAAPQPSPLSAAEAAAQALIAIGRQPGMSGVRR